MLVLSRKVGERIAIGDNISIVVNRISGNRVAIGIEAPNTVRVLRGELEPYAKAFEDAPPLKDESRESPLEQESTVEETETGVPSPGPGALIPPIADVTDPTTAHIPRAAR